MTAGGSEDVSATTEQTRRIEQARELVAALEAGDDSRAGQLIDTLGGDQERQLFHEIGRLTRELHEAITGFLLDERIAELAKRDMPDASERLNYVISMTERSANTTLAAVEQSIPLTDELAAEAERLSREWSRFLERRMSVEDFRRLSSELNSFLATAGGHASRLHGHLSEVLLAQDFQDLTGQIIRQVITLLRDVEGKLVHLVKISGAQAQERGQKKEDKLEGPVIPGVDQGDVLNGQDDVDDLLSSLGF